MDGIKTNALEAVKTRILSDPNLRQDFDSCVNLYKDFIKQRGAGTSQEREAKISAQKSTQGKGGQHGQGGAVPDNPVEDCYYMCQKYSQLSNAAKDALRLKWTKRGHQPGDQTKQATKKQKKEEAKPAGKAVKDWSKREIMALAKKVKWLDLEAQGQESSDRDQSEEKE